MAKEESKKPDIGEKPQVVESEVTEPKLAEPAKNVNEMPAEVGVKPADETETPDNETGLPEIQEPLAAMAQPKRRRFWPSSKKARIVLITIGSLVALIAILFAVPMTRYALAGLVIKKDVTVTLLDSQTNKPVSKADVTLAGQATKTDTQGKVTFHQVPAGDKQLVVKKKYYQDAKQSVLVPILSAPKTVEMRLQATGRQVPVKVINKLSGKPLAEATITSNDTSATTDEQGEVAIVLPADKTSDTGTIKAAGYNDADVTINITDQKDDKNTFALVPSGKVYFLSKRTGKISVMKSNLDGSDVKTVVAGTGKEEEGGTILLAARDWKYLALKAKRDSDKPKLYLIDTSTDKLSVIDEGNVDFTPVGWYNEYFAYKVDRLDVANGKEKKFAIKTFNAASGKITTIDETAAATKPDGPSNYTQETLGNIFILENLLVYSKSISRSYSSNDVLPNKPAVIVSVKLDGGDKKTVKSFDSGSNSFFIDSRLYAPGEIFFRVYLDNKPTFFEYEDSTFKSTTATNDEKFFSDFYPTHLVSPSGQKTFWYEPRDGKNTLLVGDGSGKQSKEVGSLEEYTPYGWYTDDYLLLSKKSSELYILPRDATGKQPLKLTDYHKATFNFAGYGYGYGGL